MVDQERLLSRPQVRVSNLCPSNVPVLGTLPKNSGKREVWWRPAKGTVGGGKPIVIHNVPDGTTENLVSNTTTSLPNFIV